ncbi:MAG: ParB/RepB/Spo0J family partition protein [Candidatus Binataceae bacterium]
MRKPLGRGLDALIENTGEIAETAQRDSRGGDGGPALMMVGLELIVPSPFQPRRHFDAEKLRELAQTIQSQGVIEPLIVRPFGARAIAGDGGHGVRYELIAGERRLRAAREAKLAQVPVIVRELDDHAAIEMSLVENLSREDLNAIEEGRAFVRLNKEFGLSHDDIASRIGKSRPYVSNTVRLLELPLPVVEMIARGELSAGQARPLLALGLAEAQLAAARRIVEGKISARGAEQIASAHRAHKSANAARADGDPNLNALTESIQRSLKRKVRIVRRRGKTPGRMELDYYDDSDLTALARLLLTAAAGQMNHAQ